VAISPTAMLAIRVCFIFAPSKIQMRHTA